MTTVLGSDVDRAPPRIGKVGAVSENANARETYLFKNLSKDELQSFSVITGTVAIEEIAKEQRQGNLLDPNLFVDGRVKPKGTGSEYEVKTFGKIQYVDKFSVGEVMSYIERQVKAIISNGVTRRTGALEDENHWMLDEKVLQPPYNDIVLKKGSQLIYFNPMTYAKFHEMGTKKGTKRLQFMKLGAMRASRKYNKSFYFKRVMVQYGNLPASSKVKQLMKGKYVNQANAAFYAQRWANVYPGIQITLRKGVAYL